jgi:hypothetical protein
MASIAEMVLFMVFVVNFGLFFIGSSPVQPPMIALLKAVTTGNYNINWGQLFNPLQLIELSVIAGLFLAVSQIISPGSVFTGNFATVHVPLVITAAMFITFFAVPNFAAMGIPEPLNTMLNVFFGFITLMAIFDLFGGR